MIAFLLSFSFVSSQPAFAQQIAAELAPSPSARAQTAAPARVAPAAPAPPAASAPSAAPAAQAPAPAASAGRATDVPAFSVKRIGTGRPMILIPGLLSGGDVWTATVEHYKDRYECHVLTLAGFAGQPPIAAPFLDTVRQAVLRYIKDQRLDRPILVGHSLGGFLSFWIASSAPDAVGGVIAVDGVPYLAALMNPAATAEASRPQAEQMRQLYASFTVEQLRTQSKMSLAAMIKNPADVERALAWTAASTPATAGDAMYEMMVTDLRQPVSAIKVPVLLLGAAEFATDDATRARVQEAYEAQVAKVPNHTVTLMNARHFIMLDAPDALWGAMDTFLAKLPAAAPASAGGR